MVTITNAVMESLRKEFPKGSEADLKQIQASRDQQNRTRAVSGVPSADDIHFDSDLADRGKKIILDSVRKGAELTREVFGFMRACEDVDYIEGTFKVAEARALKALSDGQPEDEPRIKSLSDIAKIQGGSGAASYISTKSRLLKIVKNEADMVNTLQAWYDWQHKHSGEPATFVQEDLLNIWSSRYADEKTGWSKFTRDARICDQAAMSLGAAKKAHERSKGKEAAAQTGQNGDQTQQGMESGIRQRPDLPQVVQKSLNDVIRLCHSVVTEVEGNELVAILERCGNEMVMLLATTRKRKENRSEAMPGKAVAAQSDSDTATSQALDVEPSVEKTDEGKDPNATSGAIVKPDWIDQGDWDACDEQERIEMMEDKEFYMEEKQLMKAAHEMDDVGSNEPLPEEDKEANKG